MICLSVTNSEIHPPPFTGMVICVGQRWSPSELVPRAAVPAICGQYLWSIDVSGYLLLLLLALWHLSLGRRTGAALFLPHNALVVPPRYPPPHMCGFRYWMCY